MFSRELLRLLLVTLSATYFRQERQRFRKGLPFLSSPPKADSDARNHHHLLLRLLLHFPMTRRLGSSEQIPATPAAASAIAEDSAFPPHQPRLPSISAAAAHPPRSARGVLELTTRSACSSPATKKRSVSIGSSGGGSGGSGSNSGTLSRINSGTLSRINSATGGELLDSMDVDALAEVAAASLSFAPSPAAPAPAPAAAGEEEGEEADEVTEDEETAAMALFVILHPEELAPVVTHCLVRLTSGTVCAPPSVFDCPMGTVPSITIAKYVDRIASRTRGTPEALLLAVILMDRIAHNGLQPTTSSVFRLYAACFVIAAKFHDDKYYSNKFYARVAGVQLPEMNLLERAALGLLGFGLYVPREEWLAYVIPALELLDRLKTSAAVGNGQQADATSAHHHSAGAVAVAVPPTPIKPANARAGQQQQQQQQQQQRATVIVCSETTPAAAAAAPLRSDHQYIHSQQQQQHPSVILAPPRFVPTGRI